MKRSWKHLACAAALAFACAAAGAGEAPPQEPERDVAADPAIYLQLIRGMQQKGLYYASLAHLDAFAARWPNNAEAQLLRAHALRETGAADAAAAIYRSLEGGPHAAEAWHGLGLVAMRAGRQQEGLAALERAATLAPTNALVLNDLGFARVLAGDLGGARQSLYRAAELDPGNRRVGANLALMLILDGRAPSADEVMQRYRLSAKAQDDVRALAARYAGERK